MPFPDHIPTTPAFALHLAANFATREAIVLGERRLSYLDIEEQSARLASGLLADGLGKGSRIGLLMPNGPDWLVAWLAITRIGAVMVPINTFYQTKELAWILHHADVQALLMVPRFLSHDYLERLEAAAPGLAKSESEAFRLATLPHLRHIYVFGESDREWSHDGHALQHRGRNELARDVGFLAAVESTVTPADPMAILYSSGSTADPKGAIHSHGGLIRHACNLASTRDLRAGDRVWSPMPFFWVGGFVFALVGNLHVGATTLCEEVFDPGTTLAFLERERVSIALGWPHFGKALSEHPSFGSRDLSSLRAGNVPNLLPESIVPSDPQLRANALGMTETCGPHTWSDARGALPERLRASFGRAVDGVEHRVIDPETGAILPPGEFGEICVRGYNLMLGLYKTERSDVFEPDGFYRTGDGGYFDADGVLYFKGRLGEMIKTGGANVTPSEVEQVLVSYPEVKEAYVVGVDDAERGQSVEAAVVLEPGVAIDEDALRARVRGDLSAYKVPRHVFVYAPGQLPFTDTGKIDKRRLTVLIAKRLADA